MAIPDTDIDTNAHAGPAAGADAASAFNLVENRSTRRLYLALADAQGQPVGATAVLRPRGRQRFPAYPLAIGTNYTVSGRYSGVSTPGDYNFTMVAGNMLVASFTREGPIFNQPGPVFGA